MSTYLVAFLVSEFEAAASSLNGTHEFGVYTRPDMRNQTTYAFEFGKKVLDALGTYLGINYYTTNSHLKLDYVALPDFNAEAMENWGLITYIESRLLYVPDESTPNFKYTVATIVAHETTHMWFGNLVTCHWWNDIWLNEGFAHYFQDYITAFVDPELKSVNMQVINSVYTAYDNDILSPSSPPITNNNVNSPAEIQDHFGIITYQKSASVIRMMHHLIQNDGFKYGLHVYLTNNSFGTGTPEKLYQALHEGVTAFNAFSSYPNANIAEIMSSWITQAGHPILTVTIDYESETATLTQKRYYDNSSHTSNETYMIPITYTTQKNPDFLNTKPVFIMDEKTYSFKIPNISKDLSWVIFNVQETGLYRVNYDTHAWSMIISALKGKDSKVIHPLNRAKIINDLFAFLLTDDVKFSTLYNALDCLSHETEFPVWHAAISGFKKLRAYYMSVNETLPALEAFILRHLDYGISRLGYEERSTDSFEDLRNRMQILEFACNLKHSGCVENTVAMFKALRQNGTEVSPSLRPVVYCTGLRHGNEEDYEYLWNRMLNSKIVSEITIIQDILSCTYNEQMLLRYLSSVTLENTPMRLQDQMPLTNVLNSYENHHVVINALKTNYTFWSSIYPDILNAVAISIIKDSDGNEFKSFLLSCTECNKKTEGRSWHSIARYFTPWANSHKADIMKSLLSKVTLM